MLIVIGIVIGAVSISQVFLQINMKILRGQVTLLDSYNNQAASAVHALSLSNLTNTEQLVITAAKQEAIIQHLGIRFSDGTEDDGTMVH
jgi:hypothetical protein|tara:strand:- start:2078 stop:2344 length:267 start_codon:yes stop_codon:yes gene_type:complete